MDLNFLRSLMTALLLAIFIGIVVWAWSGRQRDRFDAAAHIPLSDEDAGAGSPAGESRGGA